MQKQAQKQDEAHMRGDDLVEDVMSNSVETLDGYHLYTVTDVLEKDGDIYFHIDMPEGTAEWGFEMPYVWDESVFAELVESYGYGQGNFTEMVGEEVMMRPVDDVEAGWEMKRISPQEYKSNKESGDTEETTNRQKIDSIFSYVFFSSVSVYCVATVYGNVPTASIGTSLMILCGNYLAGRALGYF